MRRFLAVAACSLLCAVIRAEDVRVPVTADVWVCAHPSQKHDNVGAGKQLKLKGIQEMSLLRFDVSALKRRRIRGGHLYLRQSDERNRLRKIGLSTVSSRWVEGQAERYARDTAGHGATFMEASYRRRPWAYPGSCLSDVTMGNGNTLQHHTELVRLENRWVRVDVPDYLIQALAAGASDGLLVMDESGQTRANNYVGSRESADSAPYLIVRVVPSSLQPQDADGGKPIDRRHIRLFAVWYVKSGRRWYGEYAVPIARGRGIDVPWSKNSVPAQRNQAFFLDMLVPKGTPAGRYRGRLSVSARGVDPVVLPVELRVHAFTLPDELNFYGDLNSYRTPGRAGSKTFRESHRLAHAHRCTIVTVLYKHRGTVDPHVVPPVAGRGDHQRVKDWAEFDRNCGPLFDGSMFKGCPRDGVPVNYFYLPFHENWPNPIAEHYAYDGKQHGRGSVKAHAMKSKPIGEAFSDEFKAGFRAVARDFARHARERGWTKTRFMGCFNNKWYYKANWRGRGSYGTSWWLFDEPVNYDDWCAIAFFGRLFKEGVRGVDGVHFVFRADISRVRWQRNWMNGLLDLMCISRDLRQWPRRCRILRREVPCEQVKYGSCNRIAEPNGITRRWCWEAHLLGAKGVLPWQTLAGDRAFVRADRNGIIVDGSARF
ncbi:MAG: hypothetical protein ACOC8E_07265, partial [Planctomycetota bacterium]